MALSDMAFTLNYGFSGSLIAESSNISVFLDTLVRDRARSRTGCSRSISTPIPLIRAALTSCPPGGLISLFVDPMFVDLSTDPTTGTATSVTYLYSDPGAAAGGKGYRIRFE